MAKTRTHGWLKLLALLAALACAGAWAASEVRSMRDRSDVAKMTERRKTVCAGRFLVDVPAQAEVSLSGEMMDGFEIDTIEESGSAFRERVIAREADIDARGAGTDPRGPGGMVEAHNLRIPGMVGRSLIYGRTRSYSFLSKMLREPTVPKLGAVTN